MQLALIQQPVNGLEFHFMFLFNAEALITQGWPLKTKVRVEFQEVGGGGSV